MTRNTSLVDESGIRVNHYYIEDGNFNLHSQAKGQYKSTDHHREVWQPSLSVQHTANHEEQSYGISGITTFQTMPI